SRDRARGLIDKSLLSGWIACVKISRAPRPPRRGGTTGPRTPRPRALGSGVRSRARDFDRCVDTAHRPRTQLDGALPEDSNVHVQGGTFFPIPRQYTLMAPA